LSATIYAADAGDPIDDNIYSSQPFYLETRYFENDTQGRRKPVKKTELSERDDGGGYPTNRSNGASNVGSSYESYSHGVYLRNLHGQEPKLSSDRITWRTIGGNIDLFFYDGPTQPEVTKQYLNSLDALPALQQYWSFGYHQCRWGYHNWTELREIVDTFKTFDIPLEAIWADIDYMDQYRDFTLDPVSFPLSGVKDFFEYIHNKNQHFVPIIDSAIYIPNPQNASDAYDTYTRGNESGSFMTNPDGSQYVRTMIVTWFTRLLTSSLDWCCLARLHGFPRLARCQWPSMVGEGACIRSGGTRMILCVGIDELLASYSANFW
jgi:alpha-glucosidase